MPSLAVSTIARDEWTEVQIPVLGKVPPAHQPERNFQSWPRIFHSSSPRIITLVTQTTRLGNKILITLILAMFQWQGEPVSAIGRQSTHHHPNGSTSSFQVPQLRWPPSELQRNQNTDSPPSTALRSRVSSISHVVDSPAAETPGAQSPTTEWPG